MNCPWINKDYLSIYLSNSNSNHSFPFVTFVVLTVDQFVKRGDELLE